MNVAFKNALANVSSG